MLIWVDAAVLSKSRAAEVCVNYQIIRRNGAVVPFEPQKIVHAMVKAVMVVLCRRWLHGFWRLPKSSRVTAHAGDSAVCIDHSIRRPPRQASPAPLRFFGSSKPDMRNAP
jgi:hypothetical protein